MLRYWNSRCVAEWATASRACLKALKWWKSLTVCKKMDSKERKTKSTTQNTVNNVTSFVGQNVIEWKSISSFTVFVQLQNTAFSYSSPYNVVYYKCHWLVCALYFILPDLFFTRVSLHHSLPSLHLVLKGFQSSLKEAKLMVFCLVNIHLIIPIKPLVLSGVKSYC